MTKPTKPSTSTGGAFAVHKDIPEEGLVDWDIHEGDQYLATAYDEQTARRLAALLNTAPQRGPTKEQAERLAGLNLYLKEADAEGSGYRNVAVTAINFYAALCSELAIPPAATDDALKRQLAESCDEHRSDPEYGGCPLVNRMPRLSAEDAEWAYKNIACFNSEPGDYERTKRIAKFLCDWAIADTAGVEKPA